MTTIILPGERPLLSNNDYYSGKHWSVRVKEVKRVRMVVRAALTGNETPAKLPVTVTVRCYFDTKPLDCSNVPVKLYEDAIKGWLIEDDSPKYVAGIMAYSLLDPDNPRVEITVEEVLL